MGQGSSYIAIPYHCKLLSTFGWKWFKQVKSGFAASFFPTSLKNISRYGFDRLRSDFRKTSVSEKPERIHPMKSIFNLRSGQWTMKGLLSCLAGVSQIKPTELLAIALGTRLCWHSLVCPGLKKSLDVFSWDSSFFVLHNLVKASWSWLLRAVSDSDARLL